MEPTLTPPTNPNPGNRKIILIAVIAAIVLVVIIGVTATSLLSQKPGSSNTATTSNTPIPTPTPKDPAKAPNQPTFNGFDAFLNYGVSSDQLSALKYAFTKYLKSKNRPGGTVTADKLVTAPADPATTNVSTINFDAKINDTSLSAKLNYWNLTTARLYLKDAKTGAQVYDSGDIDLYSGVGDN